MFEAKLLDAITVEIKGGKPRQLYHLPSHLPHLKIPLIFTISTLTLTLM